MSTQMQIKSSESGIVRVFHIDLPREAVERFTTQAGTGEWPLQYALGAKSLRNTFVEVVNLRDLGDMPLSEYLRSAHDVSETELKDVRQRLDSMTGHVLILPSQAFNQTAQDLAIATPLRWVGTFNEPKPTHAGTALQSDAAKGRLDTSAEPPRPKRKDGTNQLAVIIGALLIFAIAIIFTKFAVF